MSPTQESQCLHVSREDKMPTTGNNATHTAEGSPVGPTTWREQLRQKDQNQDLIEAVRGELDNLRASFSQLRVEVAELKNSLRKAEEDEGYAATIATIRTLVRIGLPDAATVLVISKGDNELLDLTGRRCWHFPRGAGGVYAGSYPATGSEAVMHLEQLRQDGAEYLLIPSPAFWWLESYTEFKEHLDRLYRVVTYQADVCVIYDLATA